MTKTLELFTPFKCQLPIVEACLNKISSTVILNAGRQIGKTFISENMALTWALAEKDQSVMVVSPADSQVKKIQSDITLMIEGLNLVKSSKQSAGDAEIIFTNGSIIRFRSAASTDSLRGYTNTHLIIDEAAFIDEETIYSILFPTMQVKGVKTLIISTPKGYNWFHYLHKLGLNEDQKVYRSFTLTYKDHPSPSIHKFVEQQKLLIPDYQFKQEYEAQFLSSQLSVFENIDELCILKEQAPESNKNYFVGIDIGMTNDDTAITVLDSDKRMVHLKLIKGNTDKILKAITTVFDTYKPKKAYIELNNQGKPFYDILKVKYNYLQGFNTTNTSKLEIINNLIYDMSMSNVYLLKHTELIDQLRTFGMTINNGTTRFAAVGSSHDDAVISLAIALECLNKNKYTGQYLFL